MHSISLIVSTFFTLTTVVNGLPCKIVPKNFEPAEPAVNGLIGAKTGYIGTQDVTTGHILSGLVNTHDIDVEDTLSDIDLHDGLIKKRDVWGQLVGAQTGHIGTGDVETGHVLSGLVNTGDIDVEDTASHIDLSDGLLKKRDVLGGLIGLQTDHIGTEDVETGHILSGLVNTGDIDIEDTASDIDLSDGLLKKRDVLGGLIGLETDHIGTDDVETGHVLSGLVNIGDIDVEDTASDIDLSNGLLKKRTILDGLIGLETDHIGTDDVETGHILSGLVNIGDIDVEDTASDIDLSNGLLKKRTILGGLIGLETDHIGTEDVETGHVLSGLVNTGDISIEDTASDIDLSDGLLKKRDVVSSLIGLETEHIGTGDVETGHVLSGLVNTGDIDIEDTASDIDLSNGLLKRRDVGGLVGLETDHIGTNDVQTGHILSGLVTTGDISVEDTLSNIDLEDGLL